jgi:hypothetical protein
MQKYEKFEDWFDEIENYGYRSERFYEEFQRMSVDRVEQWLRAAWYCAREEECPYCSKPELSEVFFDQNCRGCVNRMSDFANKEVKNGN